MTPPDWNLYRSFLAVLRRGSLSAAARDLSLTQPTLSRHIGELETALGGQLFLRSQAGLLPTEAALKLTSFAESMESAAGALVRAASGAREEAEGVVRLTASEIVGVEVLPPILAAFREAHPKIIIELALSNSNQNLLRGEADIAVRMVRPAQRALVARKLGIVRIGLFAHRRYLARHGTPRRLADLAGHAVIGFDADEGAVRVLRDKGLGVAREAFAFRSDSDHAQLAAVRAGLGIGGCQLPIARRDADLVSVLTREFRLELEMWLAMHEDLRLSRRVRLLYDHLAEALTAYVRGRDPAGSEKPKKTRKISRAQR